MRNALVNIMKAYVLHGINDLRLQETEKNSLKEGEVLVRVKAAGICGSDVPRIYKTGMYSHPLIPGHEFSGIVENVFDKDVDSQLIGKRVGVFPLIPCNTCEQCKIKKYEMCENYNYLGSRCNGGFAEYINVPKWNIIDLPEKVTYEQAAMLEPMAVAVHAIRNAGVNPENNVLVYALGTIGLFIVMFLKEMGCKNIYAVGNKDFQKEKFLSLGVTGENYFDVSEVDNLISESKRIDITFECVGKNATINKCIELTYPGGIVQLVGNPAGDMELTKKLYWRILRKQLTLKGSWNSSFIKDVTDDWHYILDKIEKGFVHPEEFITHKLGFTELEKGLKIMRDKTDAYTKVMITSQD